MVYPASVHPQRSGKLALVSMYHSFRNNSRSRACFNPLGVDIHRIRKAGILAGDSRVVLLQQHQVGIGDIDSQQRTVFSGHQINIDLVKDFMCTIPQYLV